MLKCIYPTIYTNNVYTERQAANTKTTGYSAGFQWQNSTNLAKVAVITGQLLGAKKFSIAKFFLVCTVSGALQQRRCSCLGGCSRYCIRPLLMLHYILIGAKGKAAIS